MHTQATKTEKGQRKAYTSPQVEKIQIDTEFTFFTTSTGQGIPNNPGNSLEFNPLKFFK